MLTPKYVAAGPPFVKPAGWGMRQLALVARHPDLANIMIITPGPERQELTSIRPRTSATSLFTKRDSYNAGSYIQFTNFIFWCLIQSLIRWKLLSTRNFFVIPLKIWHFDVIFFGFIVKIRKTFCYNFMVLPLLRENYFTKSEANLHRHETLLQDIL